VAPTEALDRDRAPGPLELLGQLAAVLVAPRHRADALDGPQSGDRLEEVRHPPAAAHLAVAHDVEAELLLEGDRVVHRAVLDALERGMVELAGVVAPARFEEVRRAQQAAHVLAPDVGQDGGRLGRRGRHGHESI
jgi:hypothetical protein